MAIWKSRKSAFGAIGRLSPTYCTQDGVVPRTKLPEILRYIVDVGKRHDLRIANVFHAGDGNIHPILLFDERDQEQVKRVLIASHEILDECIELGRQRDRRAWDRRRKDGIHAQALLAGRPRRHGGPTADVQPGRPLQPVEDAARREQAASSDRSRGGAFLLE